MAFFYGGNMQQSLFPQSQELKGDDRQTPNEIGQLMAKLVNVSDEDILCPAAGTGQIVKFLASSARIICVEDNGDRFLAGMQNTKQLDCLWIKSDFFEVPFKPLHKFDLIIDNPPFSLGMEFIEASLKLLRNNSKSRICFLLPGDYFYGKQRRLKLQSMDCHIHHIYGSGLGDGRIAYLDIDGKPQKGRQIYDCVFDIRLGRGGSCMTYLTDY
jgi:type I restriction-modification system DNA methylase subunit